MTGPLDAPPWSVAHITRMASNTSSESLKHPGQLSSSEVLGLTLVSVCLLCLARPRERLQGVYQGVPGEHHVQTSEPRVLAGEQQQYDLKGPEIEYILLWNLLYNPLGSNNMILGVQKLNIYSFGIYPTI